MTQRFLQCNLEEDCGGRGEGGGTKWHPLGSPPRRQPSLPVASGLFPIFLFPETRSSAGGAGDLRKEQGVCVCGGR